MELPNRRGSRVCLGGSRDSRPFRRHCILEPRPTPQAPQVPAEPVLGPHRPVQVPPRPPKPQRPASPGEPAPARKVPHICRHKECAVADHIISSSPSPSSIPTSISPHNHPLQLIEKPAQAYFSPYHLPSASSSPSSPLTASTDTIHECCAPPPAQAPRIPRKMGLSKTQRIAILLGIDSAFFVVELVFATLIFDQKPRGYGRAFFMGWREAGPFSRDAERSV